MLKTVVDCYRRAALAAFVLFTLDFFASEELGASAAKSDSEGLNRIEADGISWAYHRFGSGEALILAHGFGASKESWDFIVPYLKASYDVIAVDLPGFGESGKSDELDYGVRAQAERLYRFARELGLREWHLAGNSMGGSIVGELAAAHPEAIKSLWLIAPAGVQGGSPSDFDLHMASGGENVMIPDSEAAFDRMMSWLYFQAPQIPEPIKAGILARMQENAATAARAHRNLVADWPALEETLAGFSKPTLITWGENDRMVAVSGAQLLGERLVNATIDIMPECGHVPMLERPADCAASFKAFADGL